MKLFNMPIKIFDPERLCEDLMNAQDKAVFIIGEKRVTSPEGDDSIEVTMVQVIKKQTLLNN